MHVADHALAGRNRARELVADGMAGLIPRDGGIGGCSLSHIAGMRRTHRNVPANGRWHTPRGRHCNRWRDSRRAGRWCRGMTAADRAGGSFASPRKTGSVRSSVPKPRSLSLIVRLARLFLEAWIPYLRLFPAAAFEDAQDVAGLRNLPALQRIQIRQHSFLADLFRRGRREGEQSLRRAVGAVALAEVRRLQRERRRCCRAPRPTAWRRGSSCWFALFLLQRCGSRWCRRSFRRRADLPG